MFAFSKHRPGKFTENLTVSCDSDFDTDTEDKDISVGQLSQSPPSPTSPFTPSPRRICLSRAKANSSLRRTVEDDSRLDVDTTTRVRERREFAEVLVHGVLRGSSSWTAATAWFPAELHYVYKETASDRVWVQVTNVYNITATMTDRALCADPHFWVER